MNKHQVVVAADLTDQANDVNQLHAMLKLSSDTLDAAGIDGRPDTVMADAGYCSADNLEQLDADGPDVIVATTKRHRLDDAKNDDTDDNDPDDNDGNDEGGGEDGGGDSGVGHDDDRPPAADLATDDGDHEERGGQSEDERSLVKQMADLLANDDATREAYNQRGWMVEPLFGQVKAVRAGSAPSPDVASMPGDPSGC